MKSVTTHFLRISLSLVLASTLVYSCKNKETNDVQSTTADKGFPQRKSAPKAVTSNDNSVRAARAVTPGVVHIKTMYTGGQGERASGGSGSGVVISADGYIATNNHVVENASEVQVIFPDRRTFPAKVVGRDPNTDLALLKVDGKKFPFVAMGNSDDTEVGEWVLAVGYPFSLNTTVTSGIISAKGRSIGIINSSSGNPQSQGSTAIESFIQTDAAINPGNSGGALVNMDGELIGINTAIASMTGSYAGYAFAVPVNLAKKVLDDLKAYGKVKRGVLGVSYPSPLVEDQFLKEQGIEPGSVRGVFVTGILPDGAADKAGLKEGDIIQQVDSVQLFSSTEFSERIARHRPGDKINITYLRNGKSRSTTATLAAEPPQSALASTNQSVSEIMEKLGATFGPLNERLKERYGLNAGVMVTGVKRGGFFNQIGIPPGTVIAFVNGKPVRTPAEFGEALVAAQNAIVQIMGIAPDGSRIAFNISLGT